MKMLKFPHLTTTWPLNNRADTVKICAKIQDKLQTYGVCSEQEKRFLEQFGKIEQKKAFS